MGHRDGGVREAPATLISRECNIAFNGRVVPGRKRETLCKKSLTYFNSTQLDSYNRLEDIISTSNKENVYIYLFFIHVFVL